MQIFHLKIRPVIILTTAILLAGNSNITFAGNPFNGAPLYMRHCANCHGDNGQSKMLNVPNFARGEGVMQSDQQLLATIKSGKGTMPGFLGLLKDEEILDIIAHIRTLF